MPSERDRLVEENLGFVRALASTIIKGLPSQVPLEDLVSAGTRGLIEAADRYDPTRGAAFATFAYYRIRGAIFDEVRRIAWIPRRTFEKMRMQEKVDEIAESAVETPVPPSGEDASRALGKAISQIAVAYVTTVEAFDDTASEEESAEAQLEGRQEQGRVRAAIARLPERERTLMQLHYFEDLTLMDAGKRLGLSKSWASRLHARALLLLQEQLAADAPR